MLGGPTVEIVLRAFGEPFDDRPGPAEDVEESECAEVVAAAIGEVDVLVQPR